MLTDDKREIFEKYYQRSSNYYVNQLENYQLHGKCSFSVTAFFLGIFWMAYRKMYKIVIIIIGLILLESFIEETLLNFNVISNVAYETIDRISTIIWGGIIGVYANKLYIKQSVKDIDEVLSKNYDEVELDEAINRKGGVNWLAPFVLLFGIATIVILSL